MHLTREQHTDIAKHLHAADHHLLNVLNIMYVEHGHANVPIEIIRDIEALRDNLGAASGGSRNTAGSILDRCQTVLSADWPEATLGIYYGSHGDCVTLALEEPFRPPAEE
jgi:hypothetical protein